MRLVRRIGALALVLAALLAPARADASPAQVAALQSALHALQLYSGFVDGIKGPLTRHGIRAFQHRRGLHVDGILGPETRRALGWRGRPGLGSRAMRYGDKGWDVAALQFLLARHGFPSQRFDGGLGVHTQRALKRFQRWAGVTPDGVAGPATFAALRRAPASCPISLAWPLQAPLGDGFGPRGNRFHAGIDLEAPTGTAVAAAAAGRVTFAGELAGGWGRLVIVAHASGVRTLYAHLSAIEVRVAERVAAGSILGAVGATGNATGPHLHFEVRVRGAAVDPLPALP